MIFIFEFFLKGSFGRYISLCLKAIAEFGQRIETSFSIHLGESSRS
jgi:hypothetical protein